MKVYLIDYPPENVLKVGYSTDPEKRRNDLRDGPIQSGKLKIVGTTEYGDAKKLEQLMHKWYYPYQSRSNGKEYFNIPDKIRQRLVQRFSVPVAVVPDYWFYILGDPASYLEETNNVSKWWDAQPIQQEQIKLYLQRGDSTAAICNDISIDIREEVVGLATTLLSLSQNESTSSKTEAKTNSSLPAGQQPLTAFISTTDNQTTPNWKNVEELQRLLYDERLTYSEIASRYNSEVTADEIGSYAREHDINPGRGKRQYTGHQVPVQLNSDDCVEIPIPEKITDKLQLAEECKQSDQRRLQGNIVAYNLAIKDGEVSLILDPKHDRDEKIYSHERKIRHIPGIRHVIARLPTVLARTLGLDQPPKAQKEDRGDGNTNTSLRDVILEIVDGERLKMDFSPAVQLATPATSPCPVWSTTESSEIQIQRKPLQPVGPADGDETVKSVNKYRLSIPFDYHRRYDLSGDSEVGVSLVVLDGVPSICFRVDGKGPLTRLVQSDQTIDTQTKSVHSENGLEQTVERIQYDNQRSCSPPKALMHAIGLTAKEPEVTLIPGENWFAIRPDRENSSM